MPRMSLGKLQGLFRAVARSGQERPTRRQARRRGDKAEGLPLPPISEAVTLDAASKAATMGPAWQLGMEHEIGSIEVGKLADLVVLVVMTVMNGQVRRDQPA